MQMVNTGEFKTKCKGYRVTPSPIHLVVNWSDFSMYIYGRPME